MAKIRAIIKEPGKQLREVSIVNEADTFYFVYRGCVSFRHVDSELMMIYKYDEVDRIGSKYNCTIDDVDVYGSVIFTGTDADYLPTDITDELIQRINVLMNVKGVTA